MQLQLPGEEHYGTQTHTRYSAQIVRLRVRYCCFFHCNLRLTSISRGRERNRSEFHSGAVTRPLSAILQLAMMGCPALRARGELAAGACAPMLGWDRGESSFAALQATRNPDTLAHSPGHFGTRSRTLRRQTLSESVWRRYSTIPLWISLPESRAAPTIPLWKSLPESPPAHTNGPELSHTCRRRGSPHGAAWSCTSTI